MEGLQKSKPISWASDINLSQVKFFSADESPSRIRLSGEDDLQVKTQWDQQSVDTGIDLNFPPKMDESHSISWLKNNVSQIPLIKWRCPPKIMLERKWQVGSGEESLEVEEQYQRESGIPEIIYPPGSIIPSNPSMLIDIDNEDNENSPMEIPIDPIEDEEPIIDSTNLIDFATAACKVLTSIVSNGDEDSNMNHDELFKTPTNPIIVENLINRNEATSTSLDVASYHPNVSYHHDSSPSPKRMGEPLTNVRPLSKLKDDNYYKTSVEKPGGEIRNDNRVEKPGGERRNDNRVEKRNGERRNDNRVEKRDGERMNDSRVEKHGGERRNDNRVEKRGGERKHDNGGGERRNDNRVEKRGGERKHDNGGGERRYDNGIGRSGGSRRESSSSNYNDYRRRSRSRSRRRRRDTKSCIYFNTRSGCRNGSNCLFKHNSSTKD